MIQATGKRAASFSKSCANNLSAVSLIGDELGKVKSLMERQLGDCGGALRELIGHTGVGEGKMLRPAMVLLSGLACGKITQRHITAAAIIEILHNATLLHDDVIDDGHSRRGKPTINALRGNEPAVLLGDFLLSTVFRMSAGMDARVQRTIAEATARTCEGEIRQIEQRGNWRFNEREYIDVVGEKTAALFETACVLGAMESGANKRQEKALARYGRNVGIAFQITDDLLDLAGDKKKTGKEVGNDLDKNKLTLPLIVFLSHADKKEKGLIRRVLSRDGEQSQIARIERKALLDKVRENGCMAYTRKRAGEFAQEAIDAVSILKPGKATNALAEISQFIVERNK